MSKIKVLAVKREIVIEIVKFALLLGAAVAAPLAGQQAVTGTIVNAVLFISVAYLGIRGAVLIALVPSIFSLATGLLPAVLAPMIPFIMAANIILILVFDFLRRKNFWLGIISGAVLKFIFLAAVSSVVINLLLKKEIAATVAAMMSWPQLFTALAGGVIAYIFLNIFLRKK